MEARTSPYESLEAWILQLPRVATSPHRFGGTEYHVEGIEFMHSHGPSLLDIRLSKQDQESALKSGEVLPHRFAPQAGWVSLRIETTSDLSIARRIIRLAYENAKKNLDDIISRRMRSEARPRASQ